MLPAGRRRSVCHLVPEDGPVCLGMEHTIEVYRFTWRSSFDGDAVVQIGRGGKNIILDWACSSFTYGNGRFWNCIDEASWRRLEDALLDAGFWCLRSEEHTSELQSPYVISYAVF